ncbi:hypothetical protein [Actinoallomurus iriomotensis]|nr:hypothetical protein [Actinoallomurus iriomotensis]
MRSRQWSDGIDQAVRLLSSATMSRVLSGVCGVLGVLSAAASRPTTWPP